MIMERSINNNFGIKERPAKGTTLTLKRVARIDGGNVLHGGEADVPDWGNFFAQFGQSLVATGRSAKVKDFGCRPVVTYPRVRRAGERGSPQRVVKLADRIISNGSR